MLPLIPSTVGDCHTSLRGNLPEPPPDVAFRRVSQTMAVVNEVTALRVEAPWLKSPFEFASWSVIDTKSFMKVTKSDPKIVRLLVGEAPGTKRVLTESSFVEDLVKLRNAAVDAAVRDNHNATKDEDQDDLGLDDEGPSQKRRKTLEANLPPTIDIEAPEVGEVPGLTMTVATASGSEPLMVELVAANLDYLHAATKSHTDRASASNAEGNESAVAKKSTVASVWWQAAKNSFRVKFSVGGKDKYKFFKASDPDDAGSIATAKAEAEAFAKAKH